VKRLYTIVIVLAGLVVSIPALAQDIPTDGGLDADVDSGDAGFWPGDADIDAALCPDGVVGCYTEEVDWLYRDALFDDIMFDTGWIPAGSPLQLRFGLAIGGSTEVALGGTLVASWPPGILLSVPGRAGTGRLTINYGFEIIAQLRFDVEVAGIRYEWEGDIPIPFIPEDLRMAGEVIFDPFLLPDVTERPAIISDTTDRVRVYRYDALDSIIPIPGVGGGFVLALQGELEASYQTEQIVIRDADLIMEENETTLLNPPVPEDPDETPGFGPSAEVVVHPEGTLAYDGTVWIVPELYIEVVGTRFDFPLAEIPVTLVDRWDGVVFDDEIVDVPLPEVNVQPALLDLGTAYVDETVAQPLVFINNGDAPLWIAVETTDVPFSAEPSELVIPPHRTQRVSIRFHPTTPGIEAVMFAFSTNDPDEPSIVVLLEGEGLERPVEPEPDAGPIDADVEMEADIVITHGGRDTGTTGCACNVVGETRRRGIVGALLRAIVGL